MMTTVVQRLLGYIPRQFWFGLIGLVLAYGLFSLGVFVGETNSRHKAQLAQAKAEITELQRQAQVTAEIGERHAQRILGDKPFEQLYEDYLNAMPVSPVAASEQHVPDPVPSLQVCRPGVGGGLGAERAGRLRGAGQAGR